RPGEEKSNPGRHTVYPAAGGVGGPGSDRFRTEHRGVRTVGVGLGRIAGPATRQPLGGGGDREPEPGGGPLGLGVVLLALDAARRVEDATARGEQVDRLL